MAKRLIVEKICAHHVIILKDNYTKTSKLNATIFEDIPCQFLAEKNISSRITSIFHEE